MAQHDYDIANQSFPAFRSDLNSVLDAINSCNSGTSRPSSAVTGTIWLDTTSASSPTLKYYDGADDISLATIDHSANTVNWLDSTVSITGLSTSASGTVLTLTDTSLNSTVDIQLPDTKAIEDDSGNEYIKFSKTASAVNELTVTNQATGSNPSISATGDDTNIGLEFSTKGTGAIKFNDLAYIPQQALTSSSNAVAWDVQSSPNAYHLTTENTTFSAPTNSVEGSFICLEINYNGSHTIAFNTVFEFAASTAPTFTSTDGKTDILVFRYNGSVWQEVGRTLNLSES
jgi:hypothetical protein